MRCVWLPACAARLDRCPDYGRKKLRGVDEILAPVRRLASSLRSLPPPQCVALLSSLRCTHAFRAGVWRT